VQIDVVDGVDDMVVAERPVQELQGTIGDDLVDRSCSWTCRPALQGVDADVRVQHASIISAQACSMAWAFSLCPPRAQFVIGSGAQASFTAP